MTLVKIENPFTKQIEEVEIAGDNPTQDELNTIVDFFENEAQVQQVRKRDLDFATATPEQIREYATQMRAMGVDPKTRKKITEEEFISKYKEPDVDYTTGLDSVGGFSRFQFGRMDRDDEKAGYLQTVVGDDGFRTDALGRFILTKEGRKLLKEIKKELKESEE